MLSTNDVEYVHLITYFKNLISKSNVAIDKHVFSVRPYPSYHWLYSRQIQTSDFYRFIDTENSVAISVCTKKNLISNILCLLGHSCLNQYSHKFRSENAESILCFRRMM